VDRRVSCPTAYFFNFVSLLFLFLFLFLFFSSSFFFFFFLISSCISFVRGLACVPRLNGTARAPAESNRLRPLIGPLFGKQACP